jgi:hypothetical protein
MSREREGRGRLSSIDLLPPEAGDAITWALGELNRRQRTQADILFELNDKLAVVGVSPISKSAFNRVSMRQSDRARRISERQQIYAGVAEHLTPEAVAKNDLILGEFLKTLIDELLDGDVSTKGAMELSRAYRDIIAGQHQSLKATADAEAKLAKRTAAAIDAVAKVKGLTADTVTEIKSRILGVQKPPPALPAPETPEPAE